MEWFPVLKGAATYLPFLYKPERGSTGGSVTAKYCYGVWLRHLVLCGEAGLPTDPQSVGEIGPGDSLGTGIAALLTGANALFALDVVRYASTPHNEAVLDELVSLFRARAPIPGATDLPGVFPELPSYEFPHHILSEERLERSLALPRVEAIRCALRGQFSSITVNYVVPWIHHVDGLNLDLVISQAVLEHVSDLAMTYACLSQCVRDGGGMSHVIDFRSHWLTKAWDGHRQYSDRWWRLVKGRRPYLLNRAPLSSHTDLLGRHGFCTVAVVRDTKPPQTAPSALAPEFMSWAEDDKTTASALIQSLQPAGNRLRDVRGT